MRRRQILIGLFLYKMTDCIRRPKKHLVGEVGDNVMQDMIQTNINPKQKNVIQQDEIRSNGMKYIVQWKEILSNGTFVQNPPPYRRKITKKCYPTG